MIPKRYEIYYADLSPTIGGEIQNKRPIIVVGKTAMNQYLDTVVVCPLTTKLHRRWRSRIQIVCAGKDAEIAVDQIRTISKQRFRNRIDVLSPEDASRLRDLITEMYGH